MCEWLYIWSRVDDHAFTASSGSRCWEDDVARTMVCIRTYMASIRIGVLIVRSQAVTSRHRRRTSPLRVLRPEACVVQLCGRTGNICVERRQDCGMQREALRLPPAILHHDSGAVTSPGRGCRSRTGTAASRSGVQREDASDLGLVGCSAVGLVAACRKRFVSDRERDGVPRVRIAESRAAAG